MAIYNKSGTEVTDAYDIDGVLLSSAYDVEGNEVSASYDMLVMSFNVQWFKNINADDTHIVKNALQANADIIGFQEWEENYGIGTIDGLAPDVYLENMGYEVFIGNGTTISNKNAIASKYQMSNESETAFRQGYKFGYNKAYITYDNKQIAIYSTHFYWTTAGLSIRVSEAEDLLADVENEDYAIITGDFNTLASTTADAEYVDAIGLFENAGYNVANGEVIPLTDTWYEGVTAETSASKYPTDNIITSSNISIDRVVVDTAKLTAGLNKAIDHLPILAYLTIN